MKTLRIIFCILSCLCVAASILVGVFVGWEWFVLTAVLAVAFGAGMIFAKDKSDPKPRSTDFMNSDEENETLQKENSKKE